MKFAHRLITLLLLLAFFLVPTGSASAKGLAKIVTGDKYTLKSGETLNEDLVVMGGIATIEEGAVVTGDVLLLGGVLNVNGKVDGDLNVIGGVASLGEKSSVGGDLSTLGGTVQRADGATIKGKINESITPTHPFSPAPEVPAIPSIISSPLEGFFKVVVWPALLAMLAMLLTLFMMPQIERINRALTGQWLVSGAVGLGIAVAFPLAVVLMAVTLVLIPVIPVAALALAAAWLLGMTALGFEIGERFTAAIHQEWAPVLKVGLGTFLLLVVLNGIELGIPCGGWLFSVLVGLVGVGASALTFFGTRLYPPIAQPVE
jgi:hypothetical protein